MLQQYEHRSWLTRVRQNLITETIPVVLFYCDLIFFDCVCLLLECGQMDSHFNNNVKKSCDARRRCIGTSDK